VKVMWLVVVVVVEVTTAREATTSSITTFGFGQWGQVERARGRWGWFFVPLSTWPGQRRHALARTREWSKTTFLAKFEAKMGAHGQLRAPRSTWVTPPNISCPPIRLDHFERARRPFRSPARVAFGGLISNTSRQIPSECF
jgi:hypothetical protein